MHVDDITAALASRDMASVKEAFRALANYPKEAQVTGLAAGNAMIFLEAAAEALRFDVSPMPPQRLPSARTCRGRLLALIRYPRN